MGVESQPYLQTIAVWDVRFPRHGKDFGNVN